MKNQNLNAGIILALLGVILLLKNFNLFDVDWYLVVKFWPLLLIYAGLVIIYGNKKGWSATIAMVLITVIAVTLYLVFQDDSLLLRTI